jgi:SAM-dependent methyltransferase
VKHVTVVEPLEWAVEQLSQTVQSRPSVEVYCGTLEGFFASSQGTGLSFSLVVASSVLHEIPDVHAALSQVHHLLTEGGWLVLVVPNSNSLHRLVGVGLGLMSALSDQTDTERKMQQAAARSEAEWTGLLTDVGLEVVASEPFPLKPLDSAQMDGLHAAGRLTSADIESLDRLSDVFEGFGAELLLVCKKPSRCA